MEDIMNKFRLYLQNHPKIHKAIFFANFILLGCFAFPLVNSRIPSAFWKTYLIVVAYGIVGAGFVTIFGINKEKFVYITSLISTVLGMIIRYIVEYDEVSNTINFTTFNIISYLVVIPIFTVVAYKFIIKRLLKNSEHQ